MNAFASNDMYAEIVRDDDYLVEAMASTNGWSHASAFTVTECDVGQSVWVRGGDDNDFMNGNRNTRSSHFSGALLYAYA